MTNSTNKLKRGDYVDVYHDPMTRQQLEGKARLVRYEGVTDEELGEYWFVDFKDGWGDVARWVKKG